jgi:hypothetical protein
MAGRLEAGLLCFAKGRTMGFVLGMSHVTLKYDDKESALPVLVGTEGDRAIDTRRLRAETGFIAYDQGYGNTGSCESEITYLRRDRLPDHLRRASRRRPAQGLRHADPAQCRD